MEATPAALSLRPILGSVKIAAVVSSVGWNLGKCYLHRVKTAVYYLGFVAFGCALSEPDVLGRRDGAPADAGDSAGAGDSVDAGDSAGAGSSADASFGGSSGALGTRDASSDGRADEPRADAATGGAPGRGRDAGIGGEPAVVDASGNGGQEAGVDPSDAGADPMPCEDLPCLNGGVCEVVGLQATCACAAGFTGALCSVNIDDCAAEPCQNGGTCVDGIAAYTCECQPGYSGPRCEDDVNDCLGVSNPCQHGGTCVDGIDSYTCSCPSGYEGEYCQTNINDCSPNPCQNGGTCIDGVESYTCSCPGGYTGVNCQTNANDCSPNPCQNGGTCTDGVDTYVCSCPSGYTGANCQTNVNDCSPNPCQHGGTCSDGVNAYTCSCPQGYSGTDCELTWCSGQLQPVGTTAYQCLDFEADSSAWARVGTQGARDSAQSSSPSWSWQSYPNASGEQGALSWSTTGPVLDEVGMRFDIRPTFLIDIHKGWDTDFACVTMGPVKICVEHNGFGRMQISYVNTDTNYYGQCAVSGYLEENAWQTMELVVSSTNGRVIIRRDGTAINYDPCGVGTINDATVAEFQVGLGQPGTPDLAPAFFDNVIAWTR